MVPEAIHKVSSMLMDLDVEEEPHQLTQHDLTVSRFFATFHKMVGSKGDDNSSKPYTLVNSPLGTFACLARVIKSSEKRYRTANSPAA